jgi:hypothetical protein
MPHLSQQFRQLSTGAAVKNRSASEYFFSFDFFSFPFSRAVFGKNENFQKQFSEVLISSSGNFREDFADASARSGSAGQVIDRLSHTLLRCTAAGILGVDPVTDCIDLLI